MPELKSETWLYVYIYKYVCILVGILQRKSDGLDRAVNADHGSNMAIGIVWPIGTYYRGMFCDVVLAGAYVFLWGKQRAVVYSLAYFFDARKKKVKIVSVGSCRRIYLGYCSPW